MGDSAREIESKALQLPPKQRARLAQRLISSLDQESDPDAEQVWLAEAERRLDELESGKVASIPGEQVLEKARSTLRREVSSSIPNRKPNSSRPRSYFESHVEHLRLDFILAVPAGL